MKNYHRTLHVNFFKLWIFRVDSEFWLIENLMKHTVKEGFSQSIDE